MMLLASSAHIESRSNLVKASLVVTACLNMDSAGHIRNTMALINDPNATIGEPPSVVLMDAKKRFEHAYAFHPLHHDAMHHKLVCALRDAPHNRRTIHRLLRKIPESSLRNDALILWENKSVDAAKLLDYIATFRTRIVMGKLEEAAQSEESTVHTLRKMVEVLESRHTFFAPKELVSLCMQASAS